MFKHVGRVVKGSLDVWTMVEGQQVFPKYIVMLEEQQIVPRCSDMEKSK